MAQEASPIDIESEWKETDVSNVPRGEHEFTVKNIWVDEDGIPQVKIMYFNGETQSLTADDIQSRERDGEIERTNTGHEAWQARNY